ncbi:MAG: hypothetical protein Q9160_004584 [Pyrenula sp. 1 TL-2023]
MSTSAQYIRVRISNAFGVTNLPVTAVTVACPVPAVNASAGSSAILSNSTKQVTFSGNQSISIPNGALAVSDPIDFPIQALSTLTVTMYLKNGQTTNSITSHPGSRTTSWFSFGDYTTAANLTDPSTQNVAHWYFLSAIEAWSPQSTRAFAIVGDSITDGRGSDTNGNNRWPDLLLNKFQNSTLRDNLSILNQAAGGNRVLADGLGPSALSRIERDVLSHSGVRYAMLFEGVNDIGSAATDAATQAAIGGALIQAYGQIISRVHAVGIPIFAATITPFSAPANQSSIQPYSNPERERTRQRINDWIKTSGRFDAVVDFDAIVRDPYAPSQLDPRYNSGDYLHPNVAGYQKIADNFPLDIFQQFEAGVSEFQ